jgi:hypothetical protein
MNNRFLPFLFITGVHILLIANVVLNPDTNVQDSFAQKQKASNEKGTNSFIGDNITSLAKKFSIITPWSTGNDHTQSVSRSIG